MSELMKQTEQGKVRRILLRVAYDGTAYHGWQLQPSEASIEGVLNEALYLLTGEKIQVIGASRTDAGVHALGNVAVFDTVSRIPAEKFSYALNQRLPDDIVVQASCEVEEDFHPRHRKCCKTYEYQVLNRRFPLPEYRNTAHFEYGALDLESMKRACSFFVGRHDFAAFCAAGAQVQSTVRMIYSLMVTTTPLEFLQYDESNSTENTYQEQLIKIRVQGDGFLYNMVRIIAGTILEVGKGNIQAEEVAGIIASRNREHAGPTAPAKGLTLVKIEYGTDLSKSQGN